MTLMDEEKADEDWSDSEAFGLGDRINAALREIDILINELHGLRYEREDDALKQTIEIRSLLAGVKERRWGRLRDEFKRAAEEEAKA